MPSVTECPLNNNILKRFNDEDTADLVFEVTNETEGSPLSNFPSCSESKMPINSCQVLSFLNPTSPKGQNPNVFKFYAHSFIIECNSKTLADMCNRQGEPLTGMSCAPGNSSAPVRVPVTKIEPEVFRNVLYFCYGGTITEEDMKAYTKQIIDAADRFGIVPLKLAVEAWYAGSGELSIENIVDVLIYADAKDLALLKEAALDYISSNGINVAEADSFENFPSHLVKDLLIAQGGSKKSKHAMRVTELRRMAHEKGLRVDVSREALISSLWESSEMQT